MRRQNTYAGQEMREMGDRDVARARLKQEMQICNTIGNDHL